MAKSYLALLCFVKNFDSNVPYVRDAVLFLFDIFE